MTPQTMTKYALTLAGLVVYGASLRFGLPNLRWVAIALVAMAFLLRFWKAPSAKPE